MFSLLIDYAPPKCISWQQPFFPATARVPPGETTAGIPRYGTGEWGHSPARVLVKLHTRHTITSTNASASPPPSDGFTKIYSFTSAVKVWIRHLFDRFPVRPIIPRFPVPDRRDQPFFFRFATRQSLAYLRGSPCFTFSRFG